MRPCDEAFGVSLGETAPSADLGGSSKCSNENFEDQRGEGFHVNRSWTVGHGLVDPERQGCTAYAGFASFLEREWG